MVWACVALAVNALDIQMFTTSVPSRRTHKEREDKDTHTAIMSTMQMMAGRERKPTRECPHVQRRLTSWI